MKIGDVIVLKLILNGIIIIVIIVTDKKFSQPLGLSHLEDSFNDEMAHKCASRRGIDIPKHYHLHQHGDSHRTRVMDMAGIIGYAR